MAENNNSKKRSSEDSYHKERKKAKSWAREWFDALLFAAIAAIIIRSFFFEAYRIPTPSMEKTLMTGDFLVVSKIAYGPRTPISVSIPFTGIYLPGIELPWIRLPGYSSIKRYDIVVFNYPIDFAPISQKTSYIKRLVGMPSDTLAIRDNRLYVNHERARQFKTVQHNYVVYPKGSVRLSRSKINSAGATLKGVRRNGTYVITMTDNIAEKIQRWPEVRRVELFVLPDNYDEYSRDNKDFTFSSGFKNHHHLPPIVVPFDGQQVELTPDNWHIYRNIVERYENNRVQRVDSLFVINGDTTNQYTIKQDYYFMMGDNRDNSLDSRYWGFVPRDHIVGRAALIYFSWSHEQFMPRFDRIFKVIN